MNIFYITQFLIYMVSAFLMLRDEDKYGWVLLVELLFLIIYMINMFKKNKGSFIKIKECIKLILINVLSIAIIYILIDSNIVRDYNTGFFAGLGVFVFIFILYPIANGITLGIFLISNLVKYIIKKVKTKKETEIEKLI